MAQNDPTRRFFTDLELADDISVFMEQGFDPEVAHFVLLCSAGYLEELTKVQYGMILNSEQEQVLVRAMADVANRGKRVQLWVSTTSLKIDVLEAGKKGKASKNLAGVTAGVTSLIGGAWAGSYMADRRGAAGRANFVKSLVERPQSGGRSLLTLNHYLYKGDADLLPQTRAAAILQTSGALSFAEKAVVCVSEPGLRAALEQRAGRGLPGEALDGAKVSFPANPKAGKVQADLLGAMRKWAKPDMLTSKAQMANRREPAEGKEAFEPQEEVTAEARNLEFNLPDDLGRYLLTVAIDTNIIVQGTKERETPEGELAAGDRRMWFEASVVPALVDELEDVAQRTGEKVGVLFGTTQRLETLKPWERNVMEEFDMTLDDPELDGVLERSESTRAEGRRDQPQPRRTMRRLAEALGRASQLEVQLDSPSPGLLSLRGCCSPEGVKELATALDVFVQDVKHRLGVIAKEDLGALSPDERRDQADLRWLAATTERLRQGDVSSRKDLAKQLAHAIPRLAGGPSPAVTALLEQVKMLSETSHWAEVDMAPDLTIAHDLLALVERRHVAYHSRPAVGTEPPPPPRTSVGVFLGADHLAVHLTCLVAPGKIGGVPLEQNPHSYRRNKLVSGESPTLPAGGTIKADELHLTDLPPSAPAHLTDVPPTHPPAPAAQLTDAAQVRLGVRRLLRSLIAVAIRQTGGPEFSTPATIVVNPHQFEPL